MFGCLALRTMRATSLSDGVLIPWGQPGTPNAPLRIPPDVSDRILWPTDAVGRVLAPWEYKMQIPLAGELAFFGARPMLCWTVDEASDGAPFGRIDTRLELEFADGSRELLGDAAGIEVPLSDVELYVLYFERIAPIEPWSNRSGARLVLTFTPNTVVASDVDGSFAIARLVQFQAFASEIRWTGVELDTGEA